MHFYRYKNTGCYRGEELIETSSEYTEIGGPNLLKYTQEQINEILTKEGIFKRPEGVEKDEL